MEDEPTIHPMGNARVDAAASRLNEAFLQVTQKLKHLQNKVSEHPEVDLLEPENMRLHKENAELKSLLTDTDARLAQMAEQLTQMMEDAA